jgi:hypothetical protein
MHLYFDTVVARHIGAALGNKQLPAAVRDRIAVSPITVIELVTQLTTRQRDSVFESLRAIWHWTSETPLRLPWPGNFIALQFGIARQDYAVEYVNKLINAVHLQPESKVFDEQACDFKDGMDEVKRDWTQSLSDAVGDGAKVASERPLSDDELRSIFVRHVLRRADVPLTAYRVEDVVRRFSAYFDYQTRRLRIAITATKRGRRYNFTKHDNDLLDAEQLVYLADERLHFLTCDKGFERLDSPQAHQIFVANHEQLATYRSTRQLLERLCERAAKNASATGDS